MLLLQVFLVVPAYMVSVGAILFLDGLLIYTFYQVDDNINSVNGSLNLNIRCTDVRSNTSLELTDINDEQKYIPIEFAGLLESVAFYVRKNSLECGVIVRGASLLCLLDE